MATARCAVPCSNRWRELSPREAMVAVQVVVADDPATAAALAQQVEVWGVELENGQRVTVGSEAQAVAFARQAGSRPTRIARRESSLISGTPEQVKARLDALQAEEQLDELIIDTPLATGQRACTPCACWRRLTTARRC